MAMAGKAIELGKGEQLTEQQQQLMEALADGEGDAFERAGYNTSKDRAKAERSVAVQEAAKLQRAARIKVRLAQKAMLAMEDLLDGERTPAATKFAAAKWVLEQSGHGAQDEGGADKPLHEMSETELLAFLAKAQKVVDAGGSGPIIDVVPRNGA